MLEFEILENGNLKITPTNDGKEFLKEKLEDPENKMDYASLWNELTEDTACNGSYTSFSGGDGILDIGLTDAPCIAESLSYDDNGKAECSGRVWAFTDYMMVDELKLLSQGKFIVFTLV